MRRAPLVVALAVLLVLAGCSGGDAGGATTVDSPDQDDAGDPGNGDDGEPTPGGTVTTATTTTPPPMPTGGLPRSELSWADESGINVTALFAAHVEALVARRSYARRTNWTIDLLGSPAGGSTVEVVRVSLDQRRALTRVAQTSRNERGSRTATRVDYREVRDGNETGYSRRQGYGDADPRYELDDDPWPALRTFAEEAATDERFVVLLAFDFEYAGTVERDGRTLYRLVADSFVDRPDRILPNASAGSATLLVDRESVIHSAEYAVEYDDPARGPTRDTFTYRVTALGDVSVERPDWVDEASEDASASLAPLPVGG